MNFQAEGNADTTSTTCTDVLTSVVIVIEKVLKNLNARQLNTCAQVCRIWRDEVKHEQESRKQMQWNCFRFTESDGSLDTWLQSINCYIMNSPIEPAYVIAFYTNTLSSLTSQNQGKRRRRNSKPSLLDRIMPSLPAQCGFQAIISEGIIGTDENLKTEELEDFSTGMSLLMMGQIPGVELIPFSLSHEDCIDLAECWTNSVDGDPECLRKLYSKEVKMLNLFCPMSGIDQEISYFMFKKFNWPLIAGGCVNEKFIRHPEGTIDRSRKSSIISGLAVCGEDIQVASVLIRSDVETEEEVDEVVKQLAKFDFPLEKSIGLMYACVGRGIHVYDTHNVESKVFRKYFPRTPLIGFFGNGEIGCEHPPHDSFFRNDKCTKSSSNGDCVCANCNCENGQENSNLSKAQQRKRLEGRKELNQYKLKHPPKLFHAYSTVMCLISLP